MIIRQVKELPNDEMTLTASNLTAKLHCVTTGYLQLIELFEAQTHL